MIRRNKFNTEDWWNPTTWFGQPSIPPPAFTGISQDNLVDPSKTFDPFKKSTDNSLVSSLKSNFTEPFVNTEKAVVSDATTVWRDAVGRTIEKDIGFISKDIEAFASVVEKDAIKVFDGVENVSIKLFNITKSSVIFVEKNYQAILIGSAIYSSLPWGNTIGPDIFIMYYNGITMVKGSGKIERMTLYSTVLPELSLRRVCGTAHVVRNSGESVCGVIIWGWFKKNTGFDHIGRSQHRSHS